jgi:hypothetical protein
MPGKHRSTTNMVLGKFGTPQVIWPNKRNTMNNNLLDIIERFQTHHALQEERELKNSHASTNGAVAPGLSDKNESPRTSLFETEEVRVSTVAIPARAEWLPPHDGRDRLIVTLGKIDQLSRGDGDPAFPARWTWVSANSDFKVPNEANQTRHWLIVEFKEANAQETRKEEDPIMSQKHRSETNTVLVEHETRRQFVA